MTVPRHRFSLMRCWDGGANGLHKRYGWRGLHFLRLRLRHNGWLAATAYHLYGGWRRRPTGLYYVIRFFPL